MCLSKWTALTVGLGALAAPLWSHPHVWADVKTEVTISAGFVEGVWTVWTFDDAFSQLILDDNNALTLTAIDPKTSAAIKKSYFDNLRAYDYYGHFHLGTKPLGVPTPTKFLARLTPSGRVQYRIFFPLGVRLDSKTSLAVAFYDESFFTDMVLEKENPIRLEVTDGGKASFSVRPDKSKAFYGGLVVPVYAFFTWGS